MLTNDVNVNLLLKGSTYSYSAQLHEITTYDPFGLGGNIEQGTRSSTTLHAANNSYCFCYKFSGACTHVFIHPSSKRMLQTITY